jgi:hypothetical protein
MLSAKRNDVSLVEGCFCRAEGPNFGAMLITHINHQQLSIPTFIYPVPSMKNPIISYDNRNEERRFHSNQKNQQRQQQQIQTVEKTPTKTIESFCSQSRFEVLMNETNINEEKDMNKNNNYTNTLSVNITHNSDEKQFVHQQNLSEDALNVSTNVHTSKRAKERGERDKQKSLNLNKEKNNKLKH